MRLIDADALIKEFLRLADDEWNQKTGATWARGFEESAEVVEDAPTIDPMKHGRWITKHPYRDDFGKGARLDLRFHFPSCSNCGAVFGYTSYYCPNCGSKMKNGSEWLDWDIGYGVQEGEEE